MIRLFKILIERIKRLFIRKKPSLDGSEETHWVDHIYDTTFPGHKAGAGGWCNVHGFREGSDSSSNWAYVQRENNLMMIPIDWGFNQEVAQKYY